MSWDNGLNKEQKEAASYVGSHVRLLAGPGTGKTLVMTRRILYLAEEKKIDLLISLLSPSRAQPPTNSGNALAAS